MKKCNKKNENVAKVHSIETFGSVDGPGIRFVVFLKGCRMRCKFCHNPDTWDINGGQEKTTDELVTQALKYKPYWSKGGGVTVSGGEPLLQIDFLIEFFKKAKAKGIHTTLDTSGNPFTRKNPFFNKFKELMKVTDLVLLDIKEIDDAKHKELTGWSNSNILDMAKYLSEINKPVWIRHVLVPGGSDNDEELIRLDEFIKTLNNVDRVEVLPYHDLGIYKWEKLGIAYPLMDVKPPTKERVENATYKIPVELFKRVVDKKVVNMDKYKEVKVGEFFYIDNNGKGALLFKFLGMKNGKMLGEDPINNMKSLIATSLYAGKVKDLV